MKFATTAFAVMLCSTLTFAQDKSEPQFARQIAPPAGPSLANDDDCNTATDAISGQGVWGFDTTGATTGAEGQTSPLCDFFTPGPCIDFDIWFSWTADATGNARIETCGLTSADTKLAVYDDDSGCPTGDAIACNDDDCGLQSGVDLAVTNGETYLIQLGAFCGSGPGSGGISFAISEPPQILENDDDCNTADDSISGQGCWAFDTSGATTGAEGQTSPLCDFFTPGPCIDFDIWFSWTADADGNARIQTCGTTSVDTKIAVYDQAGGCPAGDAIACNDDDCGLQSGVTIPVLTGETYLVQLGSFCGTAGGSGDICISIAAPPEPPCGYASDTGSTAVIGSLGLTAGGEVVMHKRFDAAAGTDQIKGMSSAFGSPAFAPNIANGSPVTLAIYSDPNGDGDPSDGALLYIDESQSVANADTDIFNDYVLPNVPVSGSFILAVGVVQAPGEFPLPMDDVETDGGNNWVAGNTTGVYDYNNPAGNDVPPLSMAGIGFDHGFLLRGDSNGTAYCDGFIGTNYCGPGTVNSSGTPGSILATGSDVAADEDVTLLGYNLPPGNVCLFIASMNQGFITPPRSCGPICLMGPDIARFKFDAQVIDDGGKCSLSIDPFVVLTNPPQPIMAGQTWNFQAWHRDSGAGPDCNNNFTDAVEITFN